MRRMGFDQTLPAALAALHQLEFDYDEGIDFEPYEQFLSADETAEWFQAWTGNAEVDGAQYRIFGQDGTGGYAAFWLARDGAPILEQPIVFFGSEGNVGVIAVDFTDYLWLLAGGIGPMEAVEYGVAESKPNASFATFAAEHAAAAKKSAAEVLARATAEFPSFAQQIQSLCR
jgi:hypothetical protein